jgi:hypothetical protein
VIVKASTIATEELQLDFADKTLFCSTCCCITRNYQSG